MPCIEDMCMLYTDFVRHRWWPGVSCPTSTGCVHDARVAPTRPMHHGPQDYHWLSKACLLPALTACSHADCLWIPRQDHQALEHPGRVQVHHQGTRQPHRVGVHCAFLPSGQQPHHRLSRLGQDGQGVGPEQLQAPLNPGRPHWLHQHSHRLPGWLPLCLRWQGELIACLFVIQDASSSSHIYMRPWQGVLQGHAANRGPSSVLRCSDLQTNVSVEVFREASGKTRLNMQIFDG